MNQECCPHGKRIEYPCRVCDAEAAKSMDRPVIPYSSSGFTELADDASVKVRELEERVDDLIARLSNETASKGEIIFQRDKFKRVNIEQAILIRKLRFAAQLAADWINNDFIDVTDNEDGTSTIDDSEIETAHAKGDAIRQALLDALK